MSQGEVQALLGMARDNLRAARMETEAGLERNGINADRFVAEATRILAE